MSTLYFNTGYTSINLINDTVKGTCPANAQGIVATLASQLLAATCKMSRVNSDRTLTGLRAAYHSFLNAWSCDEPIYTSVGYRMCCYPSVEELIAFPS
jgi:hypothetical protein